MAPKENSNSRIGAISPASSAIPTRSATHFFLLPAALFLGVDATNATTQLTGHFSDSPDQRNTLRTRFRYQVRPPPYHATPGRRTKSEQSPERSLFRQRDCAVTQRCAALLDEF